MTKASATQRRFTGAGQQQQPCHDTRVRFRDVSLRRAGGARIVRHDTATAGQERARHRRQPRHRRRHRRGLRARRAHASSSSHAKPRSSKRPRRASTTSSAKSACSPRGPYRSPRRHRRAVRLDRQGASARSTSPSTTPRPTRTSGRCSTSNGARGTRPSTSTSRATSRWRARRRSGSWPPNRGGAIVNVASVVGLRGFPMQGVYAMSKAAVISMTQTLAVELGRAEHPRQRHRARPGRDALRLDAHPQRRGVEVHERRAPRSAATRSRRRSRRSPSSSPATRRRS